jgi:hypothetical protein
MLMEFTYYPYEAKFVEKVEERWGVYTLADRSKRVLFIGKGNVRKHLYEHLPDGTVPAEGAEFFQVEYYKDKAESMDAWIEMVENYKRKHGSLPKYNA